MDTFLVSFTTSPEDIGYLDLELRRDRLHDSSQSLGFKEHFQWDRGKLKKTPFYKENREILDGQKGAGYFLWKPYIILETLEKINDGDIVIYADNAVYFISPPEEEIQQCIDNNGFFLIQAYGHFCSQYTKRDAFHFMEQDTPFYHNSFMVQASFQIYQKNSTTMAFVKEWLKYCMNKNIITDWKNVCGKDNIENFINHLYDMSVLSLLAAKHKIKSFIPIHDILNKKNIELLDKKTITELKQQYPQNNITYIYAHVVIWDRDNYGNDMSRKVKRLLNPKKLFYILYRKMQEWIK